MDARRCGRLRHARGNGRPPLRAFKTCEGERNLPAAMWKKGDALLGAFPNSPHPRWGDF